jgi:hypothetical protein
MAEPARLKTMRYRERLRGLGLCPVQLWEPDLRDPRSVEAIWAEVRVLRGHPSTTEGEAFVEAALADAKDWPE